MNMLFKVRTDHLVTNISLVCNIASMYLPISSINKIMSKIQKYKTIKSISFEMFKI